MYLALFISLIVILITTKLTQAFKLSNLYLLLGQISAALIIILVGSIEVSHIKYIELGYLSIPLSLLFLVSFTNVMNIEKEQKALTLLLPCITLFCLSVLAFFWGYSFVLIAGVCTIFTIMLLLLYSNFSGKVFVGKTVTTSITFIIAVLSLSFLNTSIETIYIPIFTLAIPFFMYNFIQNKFTSLHSITYSSLIAILFSILMFVLPTDILWYFIVGLTVILVITQMTRKYRFI
ncbi:MraY family glycosyltransferase [Schinkia azotoformans]|uniref:UDP-N-acetylmuramyl pentapeptide phosphotransferase n=1 Tax=Schinkia azotoformans TaxID=1454 RepID=UPI002DBB299C|nr:UDP-N-acetylmuramyl pentapeptide phosphotransferase [Schinkia azotoformans]MEC1718755.1 UDP-N-acetylmuramyl pentapeptide phosphotransferase [Schinkia azotoformans]MEC1743823.1 UDP-N-acetylmuramyl pentapeptide phosphotransferase [Schinkia azotoformans]MEC1748214.1 UDP-N-acetylmuramyl pentapeptide phosphotransferase [Schinkia azotoformans]MEC1760693.1 UDP-N-acetylmuramyl pentapeptide phosphotransferase [Schinkia azotoformans]MEC1769523.1 UDP-N-acetylmuramyl pentapeptide phosphotransferase [Sc